jgi:ribosome-associated translation inhibitor RaiA
MANLPSPLAEYNEENPEVKSYILQQIAELQNFVTASTIVSVVLKDPERLAIQLETEGRAIPLKKLKKMYRIAIVLREEDTELHEEGLDRNIFVAIRQAKDKLLATLSDIQDKVLSNSDRQDQINQALQNNQVH